MHDYLFFCQIQNFCRDAKNLLLVSQRYKVPKDIGLYFCRHLGHLHHILPHPSYNSQNYIETVIFSYIDRGVTDYTLFTLFLKKFFPKMKRVCLSQKFSLFNTETLTFFIKELQLKRLILYDTSGEDYSDINWNEFLKLMPDGAQYNFLLDFEYQGDNEKKRKFKEQSKTIMVYKYGDGYMRLYDMYEEKCGKIRKYIIKTNKGVGPHRNYFMT